MNKSLVILLQFEDGIYPEIDPKSVFFKEEEIEIKKFIDDVISRANRYKESNHEYPESIEDLIGWEELNM